MHFDLETTIAQRLRTSSEAISPVLRLVVERIRQQVAHYGYARVSGLGTFRGAEGDITFEPDPALAEAVNLRFTGLRNVVLPSSSRPDDEDWMDSDAFEAGESHALAAESDALAMESDALAEESDDLAEESDAHAEEWDAHAEDEASSEREVDVETGQPPYAGLEAPPGKTEDQWHSAFYTHEEESSSDFEEESFADFKGTEDPLDESESPGHRWTETFREPDTGDASSRPEEVTESPAAGSDSFRWDDAGEEPPETSPTSETTEVSETSETQAARDEYGWDLEDDEGAGLDEGTEKPSVAWVPIDERADYEASDEDADPSVAGAYAAGDIGAGAERYDDFDEVPVGATGDEADFDASGFELADREEDTGYDAAYYEAGSEAGSEAGNETGIDAGSEPVSEIDEDAGFAGEAAYDEEADLDYGAEYEDGGEFGVTEDFDEEVHADRSAAAGAAGGLAPDRTSRPHEWHRQQSRAKRAAASSAAGEGAGGGQRTVLWIGVGLIIVAAAAIAYFIISPLDLQEPVVSERQESPALLDTSEAAAPADTVAGEAAPEASTPEAADPSDGPFDPLRSSEGFDFDRGGYAIVVRSETSRARAEAAAQQFRDEGFRTGVLEEQDNGATRLRVAVGQFATVEEAVEARDSLVGELPDDAWVLRVQ